MEPESLPIACSLTPTELAKRRDGLLPGLLARAIAREDVASGFRWTFEFDPTLLRSVVDVVEAEHRCCRFLRFSVGIEPGNGPLTLEVTGPEGTREFLETLVG